MHYLHLGASMVMHLESWPSLGICEEQDLSVFLNLCGCFGGYGLMLHCAFILFVLSGGPILSRSCYLLCSI